MALYKTVKQRNNELAKSGKQLKNYGLVLRVYPTDEQQILIEKTVGCARRTFNAYLQERQDYYHKYENVLSVSAYKKTVLNPSKKTDELSYLREVDKFALESACEQVDDAFDRFSKGQNRFPQFKKKRTAKKAYTTKFTNNNIAIVNSTSLKLPKLGKVKMAKLKTTRNKNIVYRIEAGEIRIKKATVFQKGTKHYVSLSLEEIVNVVQPVSINTVEAGRIVGIDLGLKTFAVISNGEDTEYVKKVHYIKTSEKKLAMLQRRLSKKSKYSNNFYKESAKVARLQEHIANQRKDFAHKLSTRIADENQVVILEDLNIKGMVKNKRLAKGISDAGWYQFKTFLKYKLEWQGKHLIIIDRWYASSKTCSVCNEKNTALSLCDREWVCGTCGTVHERDENAAINIRNEGVRVLMTVVVLI